METTYQAMLSAAPKAFAVNGLVIYVLLHEGGASLSTVLASPQAICMGGGSREIAQQLVDLAQELGLLNVSGDELRLTDVGRNYANGGGKQGQSQWEMTPARRQIILDQWYGHPQTGLFTFLAASVDSLLQSPAGGGGVPGVRFLESLGLLQSNNGKILLTIDGVRLIRQVIDKPALAGGAPFVPEPPDVLVTPPGFQPVANEAAMLEDANARLNQAGFQTSFSEVANLYICAKSSYLTILAGPPGSGKSSLVRRVADALGHRHTLLEVPVRRGWTDDYAFTGAINRLHDRFDPAPTGVVDHLLTANKDEHGLYWFLLDEFNLSTPEYYFAEFISAMESDQPAVRLYRSTDPIANAASYPDSVALRSSIHLFGTVNLDETSQMLSPRLIDRANIVWVERQIGLNSLTKKPLAAPQVGPASATQVAAWRRPASLSGSEAKACEEIIALLGQKGSTGAPYIVSPRAIQAVAKYVANSQGILPPRQALDLAVAQRILPGLRGFGEAFGERLTALTALLQTREMETSAALLGRIVKTGADRGHEYDFFMGLM